MVVLVSPKRWFCIPNQLCKNRQQRVTCSFVLRVSKIDRLQAEFISLNPTLNWRTWNAGPTGPLRFLSDVGLFASGVWQYVVYPVYHVYPQIPWNPLVDDHILPYFTHKKAMESKMVCRRYLWILQQTSEISQLAMFGADPVATPVIRNVNIHQHVQYVYIYIYKPAYSSVKHD